MWYDCVSLLPQASRLPSLKEPAARHKFASVQTHSNKSAETRTLASPRQPPTTKYRNYADDETNKNAGLQTGDEQLYKVPWTKKTAREKDRKREKCTLIHGQLGTSFPPLARPITTPPRDNRCMAQTSTLCSTGRAHALYRHALHPKTPSRKPSNNKRFTQSRPNNGWRITVGFSRLLFCLPPLPKEHKVEEAGSKKTNTP